MLGRDLPTTACNHWQIVLDGEKKESIYAKKDDLGKTSSICCVSVVGLAGILPTLIVPQTVSQEGGDRTLLNCLLGNNKNSVIPYILKGTVTTKIV
jgi:hypothetical protein